MTDTKQFLAAREEAAKAIFESGTVKVDLENGFALKIHERYPEAPRSPIYLSLRPEGVKDGKLSAKDFDLIGIALRDMIELEQMHTSNTWIAGIPAAGDPILDAVARNCTKLPPRLKLQKIETYGGRKIAAINENDICHGPKNGDTVLLVDDLVTGADTKFEAIEVIRATGADVTDLPVFLDRSYDAKDRLYENGVKLHAVWHFDDLIDFALIKRYLNRRQCDVIAGYPDELRRYIKAHA